jgi:hypothetical protein
MEEKDLKKIISTLTETVTRMTATQPPESHVMFGTVTAVQTKTVTVRIDGSTNTNVVVRACSPATGNRVVILRKGTIWIAIAVIA